VDLKILARGRRFSERPQTWSTKPPVGGALEQGALTCLISMSHDRVLMGPERKSMFISDEEKRTTAIMRPAMHWRALLPGMDLPTVIIPRGTLTHAAPALEDRPPALIYSEPYHHDDGHKPLKS
jgi:hypothetical protein